MNQRQRHLAVMALLDITLGQWEAWLRKTDPATAPAELADPAAQMIYCLREPDEHGNSQLYIQQVAMLNDENLLKIVEMVTGKKPWNGR